MSSTRKVFRKSYKVTADKQIRRTPDRFLASFSIGDMMKSASLTFKKAEEVSNVSTRKDGNYVITSTAV